VEEKGGKGGRGKVGVALKYDPDKSGAPMLIAKGSDFLALKIREIAAANEILLLESG
jgi:flagellar biosynthetic protein FlhB